MGILTVYCDGSSDGKRGGVAGYGWIIAKDDELLACGYGSLQNSTNNLAELAGATEGLLFTYNNSLHKCDSVYLVSDSQYTLGFAKGVTKAKVNVAETDRLTEIAKLLNATTRWVRGHGVKQNPDWPNLPLDVLYNHWCDKLAVYARKNKLAPKSHYMVPCLKEEMQHAFGAE